MAGNLPNHVIPRTDVYRLRATSVDQEYRISVALPRGYGSQASRYPVLYLLDADYGFGTLVEGHRLMSMGQELAEILIVGIGYPAEDLLETRLVRTRDLTPSVDQETLQALSDERLAEGGPTFIGGGRQFHAFIRRQLMPFIEDRYSVDSADRGIAGCSYGGLFAAYCLLRHPETFSRYLICSPSLAWDDGVIFRYERECARQSRELPVQVFLSVGGCEAPDEVKAVKRLAATLRRRRYEGLRLTTRVFADEIHRSVPASAMWRGLRELYGSSRVPD